jgi:hypothetical protein
MYPVHTCLYPLLILQSDIPNTLFDIRALSSLNLSDNDLGALVLPEGWEEEEGYFFGPDDEEQDDPPPGSIRAGIFAIANAIPDMRAMASLNLASNDLDVEGAKFIAAVLPKCM